jgi:DNA repair protein RecN (Recombination protein N)
MLRELRIHNVAIIDEIELSFAPGMNVLTGETGAGKSIIMRALGLLCGDRASTDLIRTDAEEAEVEGLFDLDEAGQALLEESGLTPAGELLVRRVIGRSGKGRVHVNGSLGTAGLLAQLGARLIHVYGQHEHALLLKPDSHLDLLDQFGGLAVQRGRMSESYRAFRAAADRLAELGASSDAARQRAESLRFQAAELRDAQLAPGLEDALQRERDVQRHAEKLARICQDGEEALYSGEHAVAAALARIAGQLQEAARIDPAFRDGTELLQQSAAQVEEVAQQLRRAAQRVRLDPERLEQIEERLALLQRLKRKHGCGAEELAARLEALEAELSRLDATGMDIGTARREAMAAGAQAWDIARELSRARQKAAAGLEQRMVEELGALGMRGAAFRVVFKATASDAPQTDAFDPAAPAPGLTVHGADALEFYLSANLGEDPRPLARIASGGELSRIMLALKALTAGAGEVPTLIFDEVDAGIGGRVAETVGRRLSALARTRQVLCITHLPQIAALADHHLAVEKRIAKGRTTTQARALSGDDRVRELGRMLGSGATSESERYARRIIENSAKENGAKTNAR